MGGKLTCIRQRREDDKKDQVKTNQYENVDDNFTILPANNQTKNAKTNDVTKASRVENDDGLKYENVSISSKTNRVNLTNYEPKISSNGNKGLTNGMPHAFYDAASNDVQTSSSKDNACHTNAEDTEENMYVNHSITSRDHSHSSLDDAQDGAQRSTNQKLGNDMPTAPEVEYAKVLPNKKKQKNEKKSPAKPKIKKAPKLKRKESPRSPQEPKTPPSSSKNPTGLNYTEVEFVSPPASSAKRKGNEPSSPAPCPSSTTYTDVVHKDGRLLLIR